MRSLLTPVGALAILLISVGCGSFRTGLSGAGVSHGPKIFGAAADQELSAFNDMQSHFWTGDANSGHIQRTVMGYTQLPPSVTPPPFFWTGLWDRSEFTMTIYHQYLFSGDQQYANMLSSDWRYLKTQFSPQQLTDCSGSSDDDAWEAMAEVMIYQATNAQDALDTARGLVSCSYSHFQSPNNSLHGLWYNDQHLTTSIYEAGLALAAWDIYKITGDQTFRNYAMQTYTWVERDLTRDDGLYYTEWDPFNNRPTYTDAPDAPGATFIGGDMAMAVLNARLFAETGDDAYRARAVAITHGLLNKLLNPDGSFTNWRDANTDAEFAIQFVREVLPLPGIPKKIYAAFGKTSEVILANARTSDGYYGADWDGGDGWYQRGYVPQQIYMTAQAVKMVMANAFLKQGLADGSIPKPPTANQNSSDLSQQDTNPPPAPPAPPAPAPPNPSSSTAFNSIGGGWITSAKSGKCMDLRDFSNADGAAIQQWDCATSPATDNQQWDFFTDGSGFYQIRSRQSGKCLDVTDLSSDNGAKIQQWDCASPAAPNQLFQPVPAGGGSYNLVVQQTGKCLAVTDGSLNNGVRIQQWDCASGRQSQMFNLPLSL